MTFTVKSDTHKASLTVKSDAYSKECHLQQRVTLIVKSDTCNKVSITVKSDTYSKEWL